MKFGKFFENELSSLDIPQEWIESSIQYKSLKKRIHRFASELHAIGLSKEILTQLLEGHEPLENREAGEAGEVGDAGPAGNAVEYNLEVQVEEITGEQATPRIRYLFEEDEHYIRPQLVIELVDNRGYALEIRRRLYEYVRSKESRKKIGEVDESNEQLRLLGQESRCRILVSMEEDDKFFQMIFEELRKLEDIKNQHQLGMIKTVEEVAKIIGSLTSPNKWRSDVDNWRGIFELYLENRIYFVSDDLHGERNVNDINARLLEFLKEVESGNLVKSFKHRRSKMAFFAFFTLNTELLKAMKYQRLNQLAIDKILKKFDKQTSLTVKNSFPHLLSKQPFMNLSFASALYGVITERLVTVVPQLDDYDCPICFGLAYKPIKLACNHVFCVQCLISLQRDHKNDCPVCRAPVVLQADSSNVDWERLEFMERHFPKQAKQKFRERRKAIEHEKYAKVMAQYGDQQCSVV